MDEREFDDGIQGERPTNFDKWCQAQVGCRHGLYIPDSDLVVNSADELEVRLVDGRTIIIPTHTEAKESAPDLE